MRKFGYRLLSLSLLLLTLASCSTAPAEGGEETTVPEETTTTTAETTAETTVETTTAPETTKAQTTAVTTAETTAPEEEFEVYGKTYTVKMLDAVPTDWSMIEAAPLDEVRWLDDYVPVTYGKVVFVKNDGFYIRMTCEEKEPKATYTKWMDPVYKDSCMEFFASFDSKSKRYINVEVNSLGTTLSQFGYKSKRKTISEILGHELVVPAESDENSWTITIHMSLADIEGLFGVKPETFVSGYAFRANMYKCGDKTEVPHYNMWSPIETPKPSYHEPDQFGTMILE